MTCFQPRAESKGDGMSRLWLYYFIEDSSIVDSGERFSCWLWRNRMPYCERIYKGQHGKTKTNPKTQKQKKTVVGSRNGYWCRLTVSKIQGASAYHSKELLCMVNHHTCGPGREPYAPESSTALANTLTAAPWHPKQMMQGSHAQIPDPGSCEIIKVCCCKLLNLLSSNRKLHYWLLTHQQTLT